MGAEHFDRKYGRGAKGYTKGSPNYFDKDVFVKGGSTFYFNNRRNSFNQGGGHPIAGARFSIWDVIVPVAPVFSLSYLGARSLYKYVKKKL